MDWTQAGLPATLPDGETTANAWTPPARTTFCSTITTASFPGMSSSNYVAPTAINSALSACPEGQAVHVVAGTYYFDSNLSCVNGVTLRSDDAVRMIFNTAPAFYCGSDNDVFSVSPWTASSYAAGTNQITIATVTGLTIGSTEVVLHECDDGTSGTGCDTGTETDSGALWTCADTGSCSDQGTGSGDGTCIGASGGKCFQEQISLVTGCDGVTTPGHACTNASDPVTISPGLLAPNWTPTRSPVATAKNFTWGAGIEGGTFDIVNTVGNGGFLTGCYGCWMRGVRMVGGNGNGGGGYIIWTDMFKGLLANDLLYQKTNMNATSQEILVLTEDCLNLLINNIIQMGPMVYSQGASTGDVWAYNLIRDAADGSGPSGYQYDDNLFTGHHPGNMLALFEGNQIGAWQDDGIHGSHNINTLFRNFVGGDPPYVKTSLKNRMIDAQGVSRGENAIGNVIGDPQNTAYEANPTNQLNASTSFEIGTSNGVVHDATTYAMFYRWGNWDWITGAVRWCGNSSDPGWSTTCNSTGEVPTSLTGPAAPYSNAVPTTTTLPPSFFLTTTAHPNGGTGLSWWKVCTNYPTCSTFATQSFPPIGPDVTGGAVFGDNSAATPRQLQRSISYAGHAFNIPAAIAWYNLPIDTYYQKSYGISASSWSNGIETITISGFAGGPYGEFQISGGPCAGTYFVTNTDSTPNVSFSLASNPGANACNSGTFLYPDVRQFSSTVYQNDAGGSGGSNPPAAPTNLSAVVH
ncbi:MAG: hypothetical protein WA175_06990 [Candidatus Acidiferrales bacterium]